MSYSQKLEALKERARTDSYFFCREILGYSDMAEQPHRELCDFLVSWDKRKKMVLLPRGSFKSTIATVGHSLHALCYNPNLRIMIATENYQNSQLYMREIKDQIEKNETLKMVYGEMKPASMSSGDWTKTEITVATRTKVGGKEPSIQSSSLGTTKVGLHYDYLILDDLVSNNNTNTNEQMQKVIDYYKYLLSIADPGAKILIIGTRYSFGDLYQYIIDHEYDNFDTLIRGCTKDFTYNFNEENLYFPSRLTKEFLTEQQKSQGSWIFSCTPSETPITMSDFSTKQIKDVKVGDEVVGYERGTEASKSKILKSKVLETNYRMADVYEFGLSNGDFVRCTEDHEWFKNRKEGKTHYEYAPLRMGSKIFKVFSDCDLDRAELSYLAGMMDGEGSCKNGTIGLHQSEEHNSDVCRRIERCLRKLNIDPYVYNYDKKNCTQWAFGGRELKVKIIRGVDFGKKEQLIDSIWKHPGNICVDSPLVVSKKYLGKMMVHALVTETGNYVAWNYASKNCQYMNNAIDRESQVFKEEWIQYYKTPPKALNYFITIDPAATTGRESDYTAILVIGIDCDSNIYIVENHQMKVSQADWIDLVFRKVQEYEITLNGGSVALETNALQKIYKHSFDLEMNRRKVYFPIYESRPHGGGSNKEKRITSLQPWFERGKIFIRDNMYSLVDQILRFPKAKNDDQIDALCMVLDVMYPARRERPKTKLEQAVHLTENERQVWKNLDQFTRRKVRRVKRRI